MKECEDVDARGREWAASSVLRVCRWRRTGQRRPGPQTGALRCGREGGSGLWPQDKGLTPQSSKSSWGIKQNSM